ncbi:MAG: hypothetical protein H6732_09965 [Alphaproteobacteria bacterium]|nr:hypothetical protein [Alphaproteobacteria bacterium]
MSVSGTVVVPDGFVALVTGEVRARIGEPEEVDLFVEGGATLSSAWERAAREHLDLADSDPLGVVRFVVSGRPTELVWGLDVTRWEHHAAGSALRSVVLWRGASD